MAIVHKYTFNGNANDSAGGANATANNITYQAGVKNSSANFNGSSSTVVIGDIRSTMNGKAAGTLNVWLKNFRQPSVQFKDGIMLMQTSVSVSHYPLSGAGGGFYLGMLRDTRVDLVPLDTSILTSWHLLTITTTNGADGYKIYQNAQLKHQVTGLSQTYITSNTVLGNHSTSWYEGNMDEVILSNNARSYSEIKNLYMADKGFFST